jgi:hypothetical protein
MIRCPEESETIQDWGRDGRIGRENVMKWMVRTSVLIFAILYVEDSAGMI